MYAHEDQEWRASVRDLSETERDTNTNSHRAALGITGDTGDDYYRGNCA